MNGFKRIWQPLLGFNWQSGVILILLFGIPRFIIVLEASKTGNYSLTSILFIVMWIAPFILLNKKGRITIGIRKPTRFIWLTLAPIIGILSCFLIFLYTQALFADSISNSFEYISRTYNLSTSDLQGGDRLIYFLVIAIISMTFSPIGEELLYRGVIHKCFVPGLGQNNASRIDSLAFAITHLAHFGIVYHLGEWKILFIPGLLWIITTYLLSRLFFYCKLKTGSILGAVFCHAGYNLSMTYIIFYFIL